MSNCSNRDYLFEKFTPRSKLLKEELMNAQVSKEFSYRSPKKILIVDDNIFFGKLVTKIFSGEDFVNIIFADNPSSGIKKAIKETPDLLILDIQLPDLGGIKLGEMLGCLFDRRVPILFVSSNSTFKNEVANFEAARKIEFLKKPMDINILKDSIKKLLINGE